MASRTEFSSKTASTTAPRRIKPHQTASTLMRLWRSLWGMLILSFKRIRHRLGLTFLALLGIVLTVGLITCASFFAQAVDMVVMQEELKKLSEVTGRAAFSTRIYTLSSSRSPMTVAQAEQVGGDVSNTLSSEVGLPLERRILQIQSEGFMLRPAKNSTRFSEEDGDETMLGSTNLFFIQDIANYIDIPIGEVYDEQTSSGEVLDVWMHPDTAEKMGINVGEELGVSKTLSQEPMRIRVKGLWQPTDSEDDYWFSDPNLSLRDKLLISRSDYVARVEPISAAKTGSVSWVIMLDESNLNPFNAADYAEGFEDGMQIINKYLPKARLDVSPLDPLKEFVGRQGTLTIILLGFNIPAFGFLLYFLVLTSSIIARWQQRETAILMSRGMTRAGILGLTMVEQTLLFVVGYPLGIALGLGLALLMGYTESFLTFTQREMLPVSLLGANYNLVFIALGIAMLARLWPTFSAAKRSVVDHERETSRHSQGPFWYRYYLDLLMIVPTAYAYQQLSRQGTLAMMAQDNPEQLYSDPLLILVPALFVLTTALVSMRLFPWLMRLIDVVANLLPWISPHLALRQLGRQSHTYINPLLLVIVALALGIYTFSLAGSMDQWLLDRMFYRAGSDYSFTPYNENAEELGLETTGTWIPLPEQFEEIEGVNRATRVGNYRFEADGFRSSGRRSRGPSLRFMAVDRSSFAAVSWWRDDFASEPLGSMMNRLALVANGIIVPAELMEALNVRVGDEVPLRIRLEDGTSIPSNFTVVGAYTYFPTVYDDDITIIGNLDYIAFFYGITPVHDIWLDLEEGFNGETITPEIRRTSTEPTLVRDAPTLIAEEQSKKERVGIFGTLTIGFLAATAMAAIGLLINTYASLQDRLYRFAVLHAMGLRRRQIISQFVMEYGLLTAYGAFTGAIIGAYTAQLFVPFFRITGNENVEGLPLPPLIPLINEDAVFVLAFTFAAIMIGLQLMVVSISVYRRLFNMISAGPQG